MNKFNLIYRNIFRGDYATESPKQILWRADQDASIFLLVRL